MVQQSQEEIQLSGGEVRKEGKAVAAGVTVQDNMHWASCPPVQLRRHASRPARTTKAKINILAKFVSEIIRKRGKRSVQTFCKWRMFS